MRRNVLWALHDEDAAISGDGANPGATQRLLDVGWLRGQTCAWRPQSGDWTERGRHNQ